MSKDSERFQVWLDGGMVAPEDAKVSVLTATAMRGANVYEGLRAYWDEVRDNLFVWEAGSAPRAPVSQHEDHADDVPLRFRRVPAGGPRLGARETVPGGRPHASGDVLRIRRCRGRQEVPAGGDRDRCVGGGGGRPHDDALRHGIHVCVSSWRRIHDDSIPARVKVGSNYQNSRLAGVEARVNGYDDALILNRDGKLAEASGANVMLVRNGQLITPSVTAGILEGITRATLMGLFAKVRNRPAVEREVDRTELYLADEILICGSAEEVTPVVSVDRIPVGDGKPGPLTRELQEAFFRATRGKDPDFADVLTPIY